MRKILEGIDRMKKMMVGMMLAATVTVLGASAVFADGVEVQGVKFEIPDEISELVTVKTDGLEEGELVSVYETASIEADQAMGDEHEGAGWIFTISTMPEAELRELRCGGMDGMEVFAEDDDIYYIYNHPTDVRLIRESNEEMEEAQDSWTMINEWAWQEVPQEILANNPELDLEFYTNTDLDMHLAQAAYKPGTKYELRCLDYGPEALDPTTVDSEDYIEDLAEDYTYEILSDEEAPDGEYYVLAFDDDGDEVRFDFFKTTDGVNWIREVRTSGDEEYETIYQANAKDEGEPTSAIVSEWCAVIANGKEADD